MDRKDDGRMYGKEVSRVHESVLFFVFGLFGFLFFFFLSSFGMWKGP